MALKNRTDLKSFFVKNAIPTEGNFADLIDSGLNQAQDGVFKLEGEPLSIVAAASQQKRALRLYSEYPSANPDWIVSLNPALNPANPAGSSRAGLGFTDGAGNTRLHIEAATGRVGIGSAQPNLPAKLSLGTELANTKLALHDNPADTYGFGIQGGQLRIHVGNAGARFSFLNAAAGAEVMTVTGGGRLGIGIQNPGEALAIAGAGGAIELGAGVAGKEVNAGKIAYAKFDANYPALELVGAGGPSHTLRRISMWAEGGARLFGSLSISNDLVIGAGGNGSIRVRHIDGKQAGADNVDPLYLNWATGKPVVINRPETPAGLEVYGSIRIPDLSDLSRVFSIYYERGNGTIVFYHHTGRGQFMRQDGAWQMNSDLSLKENVAELSGLLDKVVQLRPVEFDWKGTTERSIGFVAQDVEPVFPELVGEHTGPEGKPVKGLPYATFSVLAIGAIKEMKRRYDERIAALEKQVRDLARS